MILDIKLRTKEKVQETIDIREVVNLWDILKSKYQILEQMQSYEVFTHDRDLKVILKKHIKELKENAKIIEELMDHFNINGPDSWPVTYELEREQ